MTTTQPTNTSEWQLYRVLQRANLLQYYDTFVAQGGDDVPQLCEAGEEEFLEIMALVGMASKPLHVRRLQKALQEWVANPAAFQGNGGSPHVREPPTQVYSIPITTSVDAQDTSWNSLGSSTPVKSVSPVSLLLNNRSTDVQAMLQESLKQPGSQGKKRPGSPHPPPVLLENQISEIAKIATQLAKTLPPFDIKPLNMKKDVNKQIFELMSLSTDHPDRLELMRKYGAIYRRFDSQRVYEKSMSLHEVCVNEAAAQLCFHIPTLLTRREDLFPLARQVVKDSGYQYSKGHSRSSDVCPLNPSKKAKLEFFLDGGNSSQDGMDRSQREERLGQITKELSQISEFQERILGDLEIAKEGSDMERIESLQTSLEKITNKHLQLLTEQSELLRKQSIDIYDENDASLDRDDSNFGGSGSSSPAQSDKQEITAPHAVLRALFSGVQDTKNMKGGPIKNTLFDEGLRIAQQYGLGDFAEELQTLKEIDPDEPHVSMASLFTGSPQGSQTKRQKLSLNGTSAFVKTEHGGMQGTVTENGDGNQFVPKSVKVEPEYNSDG